MEKSKVYYTDFRVRGNETLPGKMIRLAKTAGIDRIALKGKYAAIKLHFGEKGNLAYLRPNYAKALADYVRGKGGMPFLTDSNTLYIGSRGDALNHLETAYENGYNPFATGCHVLIADGLKGTDEVIVPIDGEFVREAKIGRAVMDADVILSLTHFKGHEGTGFGGALKNVGMGCGSREGKKEMHMSEKPAVDRAACIGCGICRSNCAHNAITITEKKAFINAIACTGCGRCIAVCPSRAIQPMDSRANEILAKKIAEYTLAVVSGRPQFHISLIVDVSPYCDCYSNNDAPVIPDVGILASFDAVALDQACADLANAQTPIANSLLGEAGCATGDHFHDMFSETDWQAGLSHAEKIGLGTCAYELITVK